MSDSDKPQGSSTKAMLVVALVVVLSLLLFLAFQFRGRIAEYLAFQF
jgi:hypothetical protein